MVVCNGKPAKDDLMLVQAAADSTNRLRGVICYGESRQELPADVDVKHPVNPSDLSRLVINEGIDELILAKGCEEHPDLVRQLVRLSYRGVLLSDAVAFFERSTGKLPCEYLDDASFLSFHIDRPKLAYAKLKRLFDVVAALLGIIVSLPVWIVVAVLVKVTSRGPIFFRQERVGLDGEPFTVLKFRTMVHNAEAQTGPRWATKDDSRITTVGRLLRKTRMDELPQLINVLKGEMSLIGPRPERQCFVEEFERDIPYYRERLAVRPGITGWAQVHQGYAAGTEETKLKLSYDLFYLKNQSITLDLLIAFMTAKKMCRAGGQ